MKYLFSSAGKKALRELMQKDPLLAFDFDGTLSPISRDHRRAKMRPAVATELAGLARSAPLAVITGRSLSDLKPRLAGIPATLVGNHGLEGPLLTKSDLAGLRAIVRAWKRELAKYSFSYGVELENKSFSLAVHYRNARDWEPARAEIESAARRLSPPARIVGGKAVVNLLPLHGLNKGSALLSLLRHEGRVCALFVGDDDTDEDAFRVDPTLVLSVRVGNSRASKAAFYLKRQREVELLLKFLAKLARENQSFSGRRVLRRTRKSAPAVTR